LNKEVENNNFQNHNNCNNCPQSGNSSAIESKPISEVLPAQVIELHFKAERCNFFYNYLALDLKLYDKVIVEAERGFDLGIVASVGEPAHVKLQSRKSFCPEIKNVLRLATEEDIIKYIANKKKEEETFKICVEKILKHNLPMRLVDVEYQHDCGRITFYYTAEHRIDFRDLVKDLANVYHTRIEMRQIGVRDETKRVGGIAICGRQLCCTTWLLDFEKISTQHATLQGLAFNPMKLSGHCGRLKCCLIFELENYKDGIPEDYLMSGVQANSKAEEFTMSRDMLKIACGNNNGGNGSKEKSKYKNR
jgi:cell fate regulator YaaT (PSP1 superfamily)